MRLAQVISFGILVIVSFSFVSESENCDIEKAKSKCMKNLDAGFSMLKSYEISTKEAEYSFIFSKNVSYMLTSAGSQTDESKIEIRLYDHKKKLIFSNYNKRKDTFYKVIYPCVYTGIHYITFVDHNIKKQCSASVLGFKRTRGGR